MLAFNSLKANCLSFADLRKISPIMWETELCFNENTFIYKVFPYVYLVVFKSSATDVVFLISQSDFKSRVK